MAQYEETGILTLSPGPFRIRVGEADILAARVLTELNPDYEDRPLRDLEDSLLNGVLRCLHDMGEDGTIALEDIEWEVQGIQTLLMAWWWVVFFASQHGIEDKGDDPDA